MKGPKIPLERARRLAEQIVAEFRPYCERVQIVGSVRRNRPMVGDVELLYIPRWERQPKPGRLPGFDDEFVTVNHADRALLAWIEQGRIAKRLNERGHATWGIFNKYAIARKSGIAVDFFQARRGNWWTSLVCRTGGKQNNIRIARAAERRGWEWKPFAGFRTPEGIIEPKSEAEVFELAGLEYLEPEARP